MYGSDSMCCLGDRNVFDADAVGDGRLPNCMAGDRNPEMDEWLLVDEPGAVWGLLPVEMLRPLPLPLPPPTGLFLPLITFHAPQPWGEGVE